MTLDKTDRAILMAVQADGRITNASLAEAVGLTETRKRVTNAVLTTGA